MEKNYKSFPLRGIRSRKRSYTMSS